MEAREGHIQDSGLGCIWTCRGCFRGNTAAGMGFQLQPGLDSSLPGLLVFRGQPRSQLSCLQNATGFLTTCVHSGGCVVSLGLLSAQSFRSGRRESRRTLPPLSVFAWCVQVRSAGPDCCQRSCPLDEGSPIHRQRHDLPCLSSQFSAESPFWPA